jgi:hypothetical protein
MILRRLVTCLGLSAALAPSAVYVADAASCANPIFQTSAGTYITATTQVANQILANLGYKTYADIAKFKDHSTGSSMASSPAAAPTAPSRK